MKLSYRGVAYETDPLGLEINEGDIGGKYRGQDWKYHYPRHMPQLQPKLHRQYRGVAYSSRPNFMTEPTTSLSCPVSHTQPTVIISDEVSQVHLETIRRRLERRLEIALANGDDQLINLLKQEYVDLKLNNV
ncbi:hypothetical protein C7H19_01300 [Aphanothece hegewaldii CCALA 016]|uniref:DUF4278 domain-containing protein n=1 Tax=Aphanothece hegewaldii CCALA 016 TaxID=2107694 RepID=A0A2T1M3N0_9CHRO|nr:DUF4278 domain-containing protein [Aphanothece hegewaldii]PSF39453.1 hypothetical protein C7H19_01300 [Aphanothece hegewaldii CCALA 016]